MHSPILLVALGLASLLLTSSCETQPYPRSAGGSLERTATSPARIEAEDPSPLVADQSEVFLATRELAQRGPSRDLRTSAFRYLDLRFSSGTLGAGEPYSASPGLSAPIKVTAEDESAAFDAILEALRGLPDDAAAPRDACLAELDSCRATTGPGATAHCNDRLLVCAASGLVAATPES